MPKSGTLTAFLKEVAMTGYRCATILLSLIFCTLTGCSGMPMQTSKLPDGFVLKEVAQTDRGTAFAVSSSGTYAATYDGKLMLIQAIGSIKEVESGSPALLCFSPDGSKLAAALPDKQKTILRLFDADAKLKSETTVPGRITSLVWRSEKELLGSALDIRRFSFGSTLITTLYSWDGVKQPVATNINDATIRKSVSTLPDQVLYDTLKLALSPYGDEIAYSALKDPPMFTPYMRIITRHLESGAEHEVGTTSLGSGSILYTADGESLIVGDANALTRRLALPDGKETTAWPSAGDSAAISPSGNLLFLDGRLYEDGKELAWFPTKSRAAFVPDGSGVAISYDKKLYLLSGVNDKPAPPLPKDMSRLLQLRKLRSMGLITEKEYRAQKAKVPVQQEKVAGP
jgi:hypothetical protein